MEARRDRDVVTMRRAWLYFALIACAAASLAVCASRVGAQQPDCNLAAKRFDGAPFGDSGILLRRYQWHAIKAATGTLAAEGIHRTTKLPRWASALSAVALVSVAPHVVGASKGWYRVSPLDWAFDAFVTGAPMLLWATSETTQEKTLAATTFAGGYFALACFASP